jgi:hypothetical protein
MLNAPFDWKLPYRWRTNLRAMLPWALVWLFDKGKDCEEAGASHEWYNENNATVNCGTKQNGNNDSGFQEHLSGNATYQDLGNIFHCALRPLLEGGFANRPR